MVCEAKNWEKFCYTALTTETTRTVLDNSWEFRSSEDLNAFFFQTLTIRLLYPSNQYQRRKKKPVKLKHNWISSLIKNNFIWRLCSRASMIIEAHGCTNFKAHPSNFLLTFLRALFLNLPPSYLHTAGKKTKKLTWN